MIGVVLLFIVGVSGCRAGEVLAPPSFSLSDLQNRLKTIDAELSTLADYSLRGDAGAAGYRSNGHQNAASPEWIHIDFSEEQPIDQIVLVPSIWRSKAGFTADGFPLEFRILAGTGDEREGKIVASFGAEDQLLPRIAPLVVSCAVPRASWVRIEASVLSLSVWDEKYSLAFSEIMVFNGSENVALRRLVEVPSGPGFGGAWSSQNLVDGFVPYLMDAAAGERSLAFVSAKGIGQRPFLVIDLETSQPVNRIHLHRTDLGDTVPRTTQSDFGVPHQLVIEGANQAGFSDAIDLIDHRSASFLEMGPITMLIFPEVACRYLRFTAVDPFRRTGNGPDSGKTQVGFAEIEVFSKGENIALGKPVSASFRGLSKNRSLSSITDGHNFYGRILRFRDWMNELARRHDLEAERPEIVAELNLRYTRQKANLTWMGRLAALLGVAIVCVILIDRIIRMRGVVRVRERIAADLHDELGANLHTIGLLSDLAEEVKSDPEELGTLLRRIRSETERSGNAVVRCANILDAEGEYTGLVEDMHRAARRIMGKIEYDIIIEGEDHLDQLNPRNAYDLFLFYRECIVNIIRHAGATEMKVGLIADQRKITLMVSDNGQGLPIDRKESIPRSLKRRARLLKAKVTVESSAEDGTLIQMTMTNK